MKKLLLTTLAWLVLAAPALSAHAADGSSASAAHPTVLLAQTTPPPAPAATPTTPGGPAAAPAADAAAAPAAAPAAAAPTPNKGDTAWMLTSTALVLLMSVPALGLFYGGLVRSKNMLSVLMQVFVGFSLITVLWCVYGYTLAFTEGNAFFGGFSRLFLNGTFTPADGSFSMAATFSKGTPMYELVYVAFQATFAAITCCLILGSLVERMKFSAILLFLVIWFTFSYLPGRAHGVVLAGSGRVHGRHDAGRRRQGQRHRRLHLADGRARLRRRHRRAHQRRCLRSGRRDLPRQAARLRYASRWRRTA